MGGEFSSSGARRWRDRMDSKTFFTSLTKMMYSIVRSHPILSYPILSHPIPFCLALSSVTVHGPESLQLVLFTSYLLFIFPYFLPVRAYHYHTIHSLVCACVFHAFPTPSSSIQFHSFHSFFSLLVIKAT